MASDGIGYTFGILLVKEVGVVLRLILYWWGYNKCYLFKYFTDLIKTMRGKVNEISNLYHRLQFLPQTTVRANTGETGYIYSY